MRASALLLAAACVRADADFFLSPAGDDSASGASLPAQRRAASRECHCAPRRRVLLPRAAADNCRGQRRHGLVFCDVAGPARRPAGGAQRRRAAAAAGGSGRRPRLGGAARGRVARGAGGAALLAGAGRRRRRRAPLFGDDGRAPVRVRRLRAAQRDGGARAGQRRRGAERGGDARGAREAVSHVDVIRVARSTLGAALFQHVVDKLVRLRRRPALRAAERAQRQPAGAGRVHVRPRRAAADVPPGAGRDRRRRGARGAGAARVAEDGARRRLGAICEPDRGARRRIF